MAGDRDILIAGGADIIRQSIAGGHLDELQISLVPLLLNGGKPPLRRLVPGLIELEPIRTLESPTATHIRYRWLRVESRGNGKVNQVAGTHCPKPKTLNPKPTTPLPLAHD